MKNDVMKELNKQAFDLFKAYISKVTEKRETLESLLEKIKDTNSIDFIKDIKLFPDSKLDSASASQKDEICKMFLENCNEENFSKLLAFLEDNIEGVKTRTVGDFDNIMHVISEGDNKIKDKNHKNNYLLSAFKLLEDGGEGLTGDELVNLLSSYQFNNEFIYKNKNNFEHFRNIQYDLFIDGIFSKKINKKLIDKLQEIGIDSTLLEGILKSEQELALSNLSKTDKIDVKDVFTPIVELDNKIVSTIAGSFVKGHLQLEDSENPIVNLNKLKAKDFDLLRKMLGLGKDVSIKNYSLKLKEYADSIDFVTSKFFEDYNSSIRKDFTENDFKLYLVNTLIKNGALAKQNKEEFLNACIKATLENDFKMVMEDDKQKPIEFVKKEKGKFYTKGYVYYDGKVYELDNVPLSKQNKGEFSVSSSYDLDAIKEDLKKKYGTYFNDLKLDNVHFDKMPLSEYFIDLYDKEVSPEQLPVQKIDPNFIFNSTDFYKQALRESRQKAVEYLATYGPTPTPTPVPNPNPNPKPRNKNRKRAKKPNFTSSKNYLLNKISFLTSSNDYVGLVKFYNALIKKYSDSLKKYDIINDKQATDYVLFLEDKIKTFKDYINDNFVKNDFNNFTPIKPTIKKFTNVKPANFTSRKRNIENKIGVLTTSNDYKGMVSFYNSLVNRYNSLPQQYDVINDQKAKDYFSFLETKLNNFQQYMNDNFVRKDFEEPQFLK